MPSVVILEQCPESAGKLRTHSATVNEVWVGHGLLWPGHRAPGRRPSQQALNPSVPGTGLTWPDHLPRAPGEAWPRNSTNLQSTPALGIVCPGPRSEGTGKGRA